MAAKRTKRERQKQRKRAEAAAATAARAESLAGSASEFEEPSDPAVPDVEEAPELDFDFHEAQQVDEMISLFKKEGMGRDAPLDLEELVPPPRTDTMVS